MTAIAVLSLVITPQTPTPFAVEATVIAELLLPHALTMNAAIAVLTATVKRDLALKPAHLMPSPLCVLAPEEEPAGRSAGTMLVGA
jgi:hypothetical protein